MRRRPVSVRMSSMVLTSMVLGGWLAGGRAQNLGVDAPPALNPGSGAQAGGASNRSAGAIPQPTPESPGMIAGVTVGQLYTDNLRLATHDRPKQSGWITQVRPFFRAARSGPRFSGVVDYALTGYLYESPPGHNQLTQDLDANGTLTVVPQHFFVEGTASYGSQIVNHQLPAGSGTFFLSNNRANVGAAMLSPYWLQNLGNVGTMTLRYTRGRVVYNDRDFPGEGRNLLGGIPDVTVNAAEFSLVSPKYQTWGWDFGYSEQRLDPDFGASVGFAVARAQGSLQVSNELHLLAAVGKENRFRPDGSVQKLGAPFWDAGFQWSNRRDRFMFMVGHRFFGRSFQLSWTHQAALLTTNVSYLEQPTSYDLELLGSNPVAGGFAPISIAPIIPSLTERQPFLMKRLAASATYSMPNSRLRVGLNDERRTYFTQDNRQERVASGALYWAFDLGAFTTLTPGFHWQRYQFRGGQINYSHFAQLELVHQLNSRNFGSVRVRHDSANVFAPSPGAHGYSVNVVFVQWTHLF